MSQCPLWVGSGPGCDRWKTDTSEGPYLVPIWEGYGFNPTNLD